MPYNLTIHVQYISYDCYRQIYIIFRVWFAFSGYKTGIMWLQCMWKMLWYLKWHVRIVIPHSLTYSIFIYDCYRSIYSECGLPSVDIGQASCGCSVCYNILSDRYVYHAIQFNNTVYILWLLQIYMFRVWFACRRYRTSIMWLQCMWKML